MRVFVKTVGIGFILAAISLSGCVSTAVGMIQAAEGRQNEPAKTTSMSATISESDIAWSRGAGKNTIYGEAFISTEVTRYNVETSQTCQGGEVSLIPKSAFADDVMRFKFGTLDRGYLSYSGEFKNTGTRDNPRYTPRYSRAAVLNRDDRSDAGKKGMVAGVDNPIYVSSIRKSDCGQGGSYIFENIPDGDYYLTSLVLWDLGQNFFSGKPGGYGGELMRSVSVTGGERKRVIVSK